MKCSRCGRELAEDQRYVYQDKVFCENCLIDVGLSIRECDPWATYVETRTQKRLKSKGKEGLNEVEKRVYEFIQSKGRATRQEVMQNLGLSEIDLKSQLVTLMHSELVKERSEGGEMYLIPIA